VTVNNENTPAQSYCGRRYGPGRIVCSLCVIVLGNPFIDHIQGRLGFRDSLSNATLIVLDNLLWWRRASAECHGSHVRQAVHLVAIIVEAVRAKD